MSKVVVPPPIKRQIERIWLDVAKSSGERAAEGFLTRLEEVFAMLGRHAEAGPKGTRKGQTIRRVIGGDYWVYYRVVARGVRITRLKHHKQNQARNWDATLE